MMNDCIRTKKISGEVYKYILKYTIFFRVKPTIKNVDLPT